MKRQFIKFILFFSIILPANAAFQFDLGFNYFSEDDENTSLTFDKFDYRGFFAAGLGQKGKLFFGQFISKYGREFTNSGTTGVFDVLELGPKFQYYFSEMRTLYFSLNWNPYVRGEKTLSGTTSNLSGSSYIIGFGYHLKISRAFCLGASISYHTVAISKETNTSTNVETEVSKSYTAIYPMIEMSFRFR